MTDLSAEEVKERNIEKMGERLRTQFTALWQELAILGPNTPNCSAKTLADRAVEQCSPIFLSYDPGGALGK
ncbi:hypothetical protein [Bradyrhizobium sp. I1.14.4]|uniref:hypothetical protein n=1 Tax=unclassified Bradyrhizobium TaxID=2631580 RepID=UPI003D2014A0